MPNDNMSEAELELEARLFAIEALIGPLLALLAEKREPDFLRDLHEKIVGGIMEMDAKASRFQELLVLRIESFFVQAGAIARRR